jgi:hypothetical protein
MSNDQDKGLKKMICLVFATLILIAVSKEKEKRKNQKWNCGGAGEGNNKVDKVGHDTQAGSRIFLAIFASTKSVDEMFNMERICKNEGVREWMFSIVHVSMKYYS